jgi:hypothetical protein
MRYFWCGLLLWVAAVCFGCADAADPYSPPADIYGYLSECIVQSGRYVVPVPVTASVANIYVRWSVGTYTHQDGTTEPIWTYWQATSYEVGPDKVTIPCASVPVMADGKEYWIKLD